MELEVVTKKAATEVGSYFVSNYPPFSVWSAGEVPRALQVLDTPPANGDSAPLGLYLHIPFCRKRCKFCYFRVYTDKNSKDVEVYLQALAGEAKVYAHMRALSDRAFEFVYFGGGTPSFLSSEQLLRLVERIGTCWSWDRAREVTFEGEPGTLTKKKLETIQEIGTTRLSLGVEHFDDEVLSQNGRAHLSPEIHRSYEWAREVGFPQINIDLIAGMVGDTETKWRETVDRALALAPDSVTLYQMEVPYNTELVRESRSTGTPLTVADWATKRRWLDHAFGRFEEAGYVVSSAYTLVKPSARSGFVYRDAVWHGADMVGMGVASFSHVAGVHYQNADQWDAYVSGVSQGRLPISRALAIRDAQRCLREFVLQMKLGRVDAGYFRKKFDREVTQEFSEPLAALTDRGLLTVDGDAIVLSRDGLLRVDELLPLFFEPQFQGIRYT